MNVAYIAVLTPPAIAITRDAPHIFDMFYKKLSPHFQINLAGMRLLQSNSVAESGLQFELFSGGTIITMKSAGIEINCNGLTSDQDIDVAERAALIIVECINILYPSTLIISRSITASSWLTVEDQDNKIDRIISSLAQTPLNDIATALYSDGNMHYVGNTFEIGDHSLDKLTRIVFQRSALAETNLFYMYQENFGNDNPTSKTLKETLKSFRDNFLISLSAVGLIPMNTGGDL